MRVGRLLLSLVLCAGAAVVGAQASAGALVAGATLESNSADINTFQFVNDTHQRNTDATDSDFIRFATHEDPPKETGQEGTASAFVNQATTMETSAQPPFPLSPLNDIATSGTATSASTATGNGAPVPVADSNGTLSVTFQTSGDVPAFFSGAEFTTNTDAADSCSLAEVDLSGPNAFARHFHAYTGSCGVSHPAHQRAWAQTLTLAAGDYDLEVNYQSEVDNNEIRSMSASAKVSLNLSFFPPHAAFSTSLSGSTAHFDGSNSTPGLTNSPLAKWVWTFGDGTSKTTTGPTVSHTYPRAPTRVRRYPVTLTVIDQGGARSAPASHTVRGTATSFGVTRTVHKLTVAGAVRPNRSGHHVAVVLLRKSAGSFHVIGKHLPALDSTSQFVTSFGRPAAGTCRVLASYPGDATHLASQRVKTVSC